MRAGRPAHYNLEKVKKLKNGELVDVQMSLSPIRASDGTLIWRLQDCPRYQPPQTRRACRTSPLRGPAMVLTSARP